jgi:hypothetical protein
VTPERAASWPHVVQSDVAPAVDDEKVELDSDDVELGDDVDCAVGVLRSLEHDATTSERATTARHHRRATART